MRSWVEISLGQIRANFRAVQALVGDTVEVMPVVKADAYRHGAVAVSHALEAEGAQWLAVSNVEEGCQLRQAGTQSRIVVMADFLEDEREMLGTHHLTPVIHSLEDLPAVRVPYHLKIDTGMNRLGTRAAPDEIARAVAAAPAPLEGLMTHFASSGNYDSKQTEQQLQCFENVVQGLRRAGITPRYVHSSATTPIAYRRSEAWGNLVRPGHAIYGYVSPARGAPARALDVAPALTWKVTVLEVKDVEAGARIGYGGIHLAQGPMRIAVLGGRIRRWHPSSFGKSRLRDRAGQARASRGRGVDGLDHDRCDRLRGSKGGRRGYPAWFRRRRFHQRPTDGEMGRDDLLRRAVRHSRTREAHLSGLDVQIAHVECVVLDKLAARFDVLAHERSENLIALHDVFERYLKQSTCIYVHRGFPQLLGIHLAQALIALDADLAHALVLHMRQ